MESTNVSTEAANVSAQDSAQQPAEQPSQQPAPDTGSASAPAADAPAQPDHAAEAPAPQLSAVDLIARAEVHIAELAQRSVDAKAQIDALADAAARGTVDADALNQIGEHEELIEQLDSERVAIEKGLSPLRDAIARVQAEQAVADAAAKRAEITSSIVGLFDACAEATKAVSDAARALGAAVQRRRDLAKQFRESLSDVVRDPRQLRTVVMLAEGVVADSPTLEQFVTLETETVIPSDATIATRAQQVRDRIAEATK